jgi:hypothetical protein
MKTMRFAALIIAAASFNSFAGDPTGQCMAGLAGDARLVAIADKVARDDATSLTLHRYASGEERAALAVWHGLRRHCFDAGEQFRRNAFSAQDRTVMQSAFMFQQVLLSRLQQGEVTYAEFNRRRAELAEGFDTRI